MLERMILWELGQVSGTTVDYGKYPKWLLRQKLTDRQNDFVSRSECITKFALLVAKADYHQYRMPLNCMDKGIISIKYYTDADSYEDIELKDQQFLDENRRGWLSEGAGTPEIAYMGNFYGNIPVVGFCPKPDTDGTNYALSPETGIAIGGDLPAASNNYTGLATSGNATTLGDTAVDFTTMGLVGGMYVRNVTDGSYGYILSVAAHVITLAAALAGGSANVFAAGDSYEILAGEYGVITSWENDDQYIFGAEVGLIANITVPAGNFRVEYVPYPLPFSYDPSLSDAAQGSDDQYPDIPKLHHQALAFGVVADLLAQFHETSKEFQRAGWYEQKFNNALAQAMSGRKFRPFNEKNVNFHPAKRGR